MSEGSTEASVTIDEQSSAPVVQVGAQRPGKQRHGRGGDGGEKVKNILDTARGFSAACTPLLSTRSQEHAAIFANPVQVPHRASAPPRLAAPASAEDSRARPASGPHQPCDLGTTGRCRLLRTAASVRGRCAWLGGATCSSVRSAITSSSSADDAMAPRCRVLAVKMTASHPSSIPIYSHHPGPVRRPGEAKMASEEDDGEMETEDFSSSADLSLADIIGVLNKPEKQVCCGRVRGLERSKTTGRC